MADKKEEAMPVVHLDKLQEALDKLCATSKTVQEHLAFVKKGDNSNKMITMLHLDFVNMVNDQNIVIGNVKNLIHRVEAIENYLNALAEKNKKSSIILKN